MSLRVLVLTGQALAKAVASPPAKGTTEAPPYERKLAEADAKRVEELEKKIEELWEAGSFKEAQSAARTILELRRRVQGANHWQTGDAQRLFGTLENIAALPADAQPNLPQVMKAGREAAQLQAQGRYTEATSLWRRESGVYQRHLGETDPHKATSYPH